MILVDFFQLRVFYDAPLLGGHLSTLAPWGLSRAIPLSSGALKQSHPWDSPVHPTATPEVGGTAVPQRWTHGAVPRGCPKRAGPGGSAVPVLLPPHPRSSASVPRSAAPCRGGGCRRDTAGWERGWGQARDLVSTARHSTAPRWARLRGEHRPRQHGPGVGHGPRRAQHGPGVRTARE